MKLHKFGKQPNEAGEIEDLCDTCVFWADKRCYRHAPKPRILTGLKGYTWSVWPITKATDFCGDGLFEDKEQGDGV